MSLLLQLQIWQEVSQFRTGSISSQQFVLLMYATSLLRRNRQVVEYQELDVQYMIYMRRFIGAGGAGQPATIDPRPRRCVVQVRLCMHTVTSCRRRRREDATSRANQGCFFERLSKKASAGLAQQKCLSIAQHSRRIRQNVIRERRFVPVAQRKRGQFLPHLRR